MILTTFLTVLKTVWPFLKEAFFQGRTFVQVVKENKLAFVLILALGMSVFLNYVSIGKLLQGHTSTAIKPPKAASSPDKMSPTADKGEEIPKKDDEVLSDDEKKQADKIEDRFKILYGK